MWAPWPGELSSTEVLPARPHQGQGLDHDLSGGLKQDAEVAKLGGESIQAEAGSEGSVGRDQVMLPGPSLPEDAW